MDSCKTGYVPLQKRNQSFALNPSMEVEHAKIWNSHVLIPFSISNNMHVFLVPFPDSSINTKKVNALFPGYPNCKPRLVLEGPYEMGLKSAPRRFFRSASYIRKDNYHNWIKKVERK
ncbi:hypothetical protein MTR_5g057070 [Medicago truncatula]|uniref:Uncharacterized protein n=1 Tax=Medicago truncatula TaxID=3880 RepID=G7K1M9_MEDTR|nr:hypothetical protein MTR_5g057070 [Medicago truncatula]